MKTYKDYIAENDNEAIFKELANLSNKHYSNVGKLLNKYRFGFDNDDIKNTGKWKYSAIYKNPYGNKIALITDVQPFYNKGIAFIWKYAEDLSSFPPKNIFNNDNELEKKIKSVSDDWSIVLKNIPDIYKKNLVDLEKYLKNNF